MIGAIGSRRRVSGGQQMCPGFSGRGDWIVGVFDGWWWWSLRVNELVEGGKRTQSQRAFSGCEWVPGWLQVIDPDGLRGGLGNRLVLDQA